MYAPARHPGSLTKKRLQNGLLLGAVAAIGILGFIQVGASDQTPLFKRDLAQGYSEIAKFALIRTHDSAAESYFQNKSDRAHALYDVDPEWPTAWTLSPALQASMMGERQNLVAAVRRLKSGADATDEAIAQVNFDCWVALSSVASLQAESERCRNAFQAAMQQLGAS
jgi:hypothetical protein